MRVLILGGNGMIGHKMYQVISKVYSDTWVTLRNSLNSYNFSFFFNPNKVIENINLLDFHDLKNRMDEINPDIIINCCGVTIRRGVNEIVSNSIILNSALPHFLNEWVCYNNKRLIHFSTDCVFSGDKNFYTEDDIKDSMDIYGLTKSLGEVSNSSNTITLRGSMIGRELENKTELLEWFLKQKNKKINGFSKVVYSGITTIKMAEIVLNIINKHPNLSGIFNVSSTAISKMDLLTLFNKYFKTNALIIEDKTYESCKNLISNKLFKHLGIEQPTWENLIIELELDSIRNSELYN